MIVTCQNCDTSFQLDESRVPAQGIRVRCSRCKEAFFLARPSADPDKAIHEIAREAARAPSAPTPTATEDLDSTTRVARTTSDAATRSTEDEEEHDWEFNLDPPNRGAAAAKAHEDADAGLDWESDGGSSGLSLEGEDDEPDPEPEGEVSAFGTVDDFSSLMEGDGDESDAATAAATRVTTTDRSASPQPQAGHYAAAGRRDDLGDPESWDFFGDQTAAPGDGSPSSVLGRIALASVPASETTDFASALDGSEWDDDGYDEATATTTPGVVERSIVWIGHSIGWSATVLLASVVVISGFWTTAQSLVTSSQVVRFGSFEARELQGHWIDTARGETLLRVSGQLVNMDAGTATLGGLLEVSLVDGDGNHLALDPQPAGEALPVADLRELSPAAMRIVVDRAAFSLAHRPIAPSEVVPFQTLFQDVPTRAARFALSIADRPLVASDGVRAGDGSPAPIVVDGATSLAIDGAVEGSERIETPAAREADDLTWGE